jgi:hypothetical protein
MRPVEVNEETPTECFLLITMHVDFFCGHRPVIGVSPCVQEARAARLRDLWVM